MRFSSFFFSEKKWKKNEKKWNWLEIQPKRDFSFLFYFIFFRKKRKKTLKKMMKLLEIQEKRKKSILFFLKKESSKKMIATCYIVFSERGIRTWWDCHKTIQTPPRIVCGDTYHILWQSRWHSNPLIEKNVFWTEICLWTREK